jgi:hypothetical protein
MSFLDNENQMVIDAIIQEVSEQLFEEWNNANLDEGEIYADYQILSLAGSNYLNGRFNQFYDLKPGDEYYLDWDEEA